MEVRCSSHLVEAAAAAGMVVEVAMAAAHATATVHPGTRGLAGEIRGTRIVDIADVAAAAAARAVAAVREAGVADGLALARGIAGDKVYFFKFRNLVMLVCQMLTHSFFCRSI